MADSCRALAGGGGLAEAAALVGGLADLVEANAMCPTPVMLNDGAAGTTGGLFRRDIMH